MNYPSSLSDLSTLGLDHDTLHSLISRLDLWPKLLLRQEKEFIASIVHLDNSFVDSRRSKILGDQTLDQYLASREISPEQFDLDLRLDECLRLFSEQQFGAGIEDQFLSSNGGHDQIVYSLMRVKDPGLARELWIRLEEGEDTFSELASKFGEGPEATKRGVIGPTPIGSIHPKELASLLRSLQIGEIHPPRQLGDWIIILRLEDLKPARLDSSMRAYLLQQQLSKFLRARVKSRLSGIPVDTLTYYPE